MKKLSKQDAARKQELADELDKAHTALEGATQTYNSIVADVNAFKSGVASDIQSYIDERSEKWSESSAASSYEEWKSSWEEELDEADSYDMANGDALRDLEDEVSL